GNFAGSTSNPVQQTINPAPTSTALTTSGSPSTFGQSVTFTATVTSGAGTPGGSVAFMEGAATLGTGNLDASGVATFSTSSLSAAGHPITAVSGATGNFAGSTSAGLTQTVNPAPTTTAVLPNFNPSNFGQSVTFTATVTSGAGTPGGMVTFMEGAATLGTGNLNASGVATYSTSALSAGSHTITAV